MIVNGTVGQDANKIHELKLSDLKITRIDNDNLHMMKLSGVLRRLDLSFNLLETLDNIDRMQNLRDLNVSMNSINQINNLNKLANLKILNLEGNQIKQLAGLKSLRKLEKLSLKANLITEVLP